MPGIREAGEATQSVHSYGGRSRSLVRCLGAGRLGETSRQLHRAPPGPVRQKNNKLSTFEGTLKGTSSSIGILALGYTNNSALYISLELHMLIEEEKYTIIVLIPGRLIFNFPY